MLWGPFERRRSNISRKRLYDHLRFWEDWRITPASSKCCLLPYPFFKDTILRHCTTSSVIHPLSKWNCYHCLHTLSFFFSIYLQVHWGTLFCGHLSSQNCKYIDALMHYSSKTNEYCLLHLTQNTLHALAGSRPLSRLLHLWLCCGYQVLQPGVDCAPNTVSTDMLYCIGCDALMVCCTAVFKWNNSITQFEYGNMHQFRKADRSLIIVVEDCGMNGYPIERCRLSIILSCWDSFWTWLDFESS